MLKTLEGVPFQDLDAFVAENPGKGFILVCDFLGDELEIPGEKAEHFYEVTYTSDCYPGWVEDLGWILHVSDEGDVMDQGPGVL